MKKIVNPCICDVGKWRTNAYAEIRYEDGKLSIHGVIGPLSSGNCLGSAGQCVDGIARGTPTKDWTQEMLDKFCAIWNEWHLNDMHPECEHQRSLGWPKMAKEIIYLYHYKLNDDACAKQRAAKNAAMFALRHGQTFTPTEEQAKFAAMDYFYDTYDEITEDSVLSAYYVPYKSCIGTPTAERKTRGWVNYGEKEGYSDPCSRITLKNPKGILGKPCPMCGYKYGSSWKKVEVPKDVIDWIFSLPDTKKQPAWV